MECDVEASRLVHQESAIRTPSLIGDGSALLRPATNTLLRLRDAASSTPGRRTFTVKLFPHNAFVSAISKILPVSCPGFATTLDLDFHPKRTKYMLRHVIAYRQPLTEILIQRPTKFAYLSCI
jgi:hypothetical protein